MELLTELANIFPTDRITTGHEVEENYYHIWKMEEPLQAKAIVYPLSTDEVSKTLKLCHSFNQAVIVFGGRTNLVGSTETVGDEVLISMEKMNQILEVDQGSRTITVSSGVILETIQDAARDKDLLFPLNFGAKGTAQIGGIISTNAGGLRVLKYGMTRNLVLGIEAVLANGTIVSSMKKLIKDNSAYDLKQLFIGSEGTIGVVTQAVLKLTEAPKSRNSAYVGINGYSKVVSFLKFIDQGLSGLLSGYELIWAETYKQMTNKDSGSRPPLPYAHEYYVLIESLGSHQDKDQEQMIGLLEQALEDELIQDAAIAYTKSDLDWFWKIREDVHVLVSACKHDQHFDISLPIPLIGSVLDGINKSLKSLAGVNQVFIFGHVADGNIHLIISKEDDTEKLKNNINDLVYNPLQPIGGSVSAEHGIGLHKKPYLHLCRTEQEIEMMKTIKLALDPKNILNPNKVININD